MTVVGVLKNIFAYCGLCVMLVVAPIAIGLAVLYRSIELILKYRRFKNIAGEVAVVTGAGHGLGRSIAWKLASKGCHVAVVDINLKGAEETVEMIKSQYKVKCKAYEVDVTSNEQVLSLNNDVKADLGIATILINNAGIVLLSNFIKPSFEEIQRMINVNLMAHFVTTNIFLENMKSQRKGHIVAICSATSMFPLVHNEAYCASKAGVYGLMRTLRLQFKLNDFGDIHTTTVCPSFLASNDVVVDVVRQLQLNKQITLIKGDDAAREIVNAMLRNEVELFLPRGFTVLVRLFNAFPAPCQDTLSIVLTKIFSKFHQKVWNIKVKAVDNTR